MVLSGFAAMSLPDILVDSRRRKLSGPCREEESDQATAQETLQRSHSACRARSARRAVVSQRPASLQASRRRPATYRAAKWHPFGIVFRAGGLFPMAKKPKSPTEITSIRHKKDTRVNIPTEELRDFVAEDEKAPKAMLYPRDPSLDPQLVWKGKDEQDQPRSTCPSSRSTSRRRCTRRRSSRTCATRRRPASRSPS